MEKNRILTHSITHSPSLFGAPETEAVALRKKLNGETDLRKSQAVAIITQASNFHYKYTEYLNNDSLRGTRKCKVYATRKVHENDRRKNR